MKYRIINSIRKRFGFSILGAVLFAAAATLFTGRNYIGLKWIAIAGGLVFIAVTIFYAIVSTFFDEDKKDENILDN